MAWLVEIQQGGAVPFLRGWSHTTPRWTWSTSPWPGPLLRLPWGFRAGWWPIQREWVGRLLPRSALTGSW